MASPVAITIERDSRGRAGLVSSFGSQRSYGTVKESSGITARGRLCDFIIHSVHEEDTLQGLAVRYGVTVRVDYVVFWGFFVATLVSRM